MPKYVCLSPIKAGKSITGVGEEITLDKDVAGPLLKAGRIASPADAKKMLEASAPADMASMQNRIDELEAENDGQREQNAALEKQVGELTEKVDAAKSGKPGDNPKLPGT